ncbi:class I SAM-dependent DNA methyltransferase [Piscibacillus halophilus]|uniref:class I SAM-dependent DNA methyltransferase n=1 Tax=Piscibacillus halophilus TaxID=571933 RepID=UPI00158DBEDC|nr:class I SAM-dependent methyltransferase [Piscibacillus halophilus]
MYKKMADVYDDLMNDAPYDEWLHFINFLTPTSNIKILDMGCGTGEIAIRLENQGYEVKAFDLSEDMIKVAASKVRSQSVTFFQNDIRTFNLNETFDLIISFCDVINYVTNKNELMDVFSRAYQHLDERGVFSFDVHSESYIDWLVEQEIFSAIENDVSYVWFTEPGGQAGSIEHDLTFFVKQENGLYKRHDERHHQRTFAISEYVDMLKEAGFNKIKTYYDFSQKEITSTEESHDVDRVFFVCHKE